MNPSFSCRLLSLFLSQNLHHYYIIALFKGRLVNSSQAIDLAMLLILLREGLVDPLEILLNNFSIYLKLHKQNKSVCSSLNLAKEVFKGSISMNSLEYAIFYLLKYYRDEIAEVEHIDLDFEYDNYSSVTIVIQVNEHKVTSIEDMNKLIGL